MSQELYRDWVEYYKMKGLKGGDLREISGYTHGLAQLTEPGLEEIITVASTYLDLNHANRLLDVGCGAGLLTVKLIDRVGILVGIDASREMMLAGAADQFEKVQATADRLPFSDATFDKIFCHSIFQYFPNYEYAVNVIAEMQRVLRKRGKSLIMDIPDLAKKDDYSRVKVPDQHNLLRTFYDKEWFINLVPNAYLFEHEIPDYGNSQFRFNVLIQR